MIRRSKSADNSWKLSSATLIMPCPFIIQSWQVGSLNWTECLWTKTPHLILVYLYRSFVVRKLLGFICNRHQDQIFVFSVLFSLLTVIKFTKNGGMWIFFFGPLPPLPQLPSPPQQFLPLILASAVFARGQETEENSKGLFFILLLERVGY